MTEHHQNSDWHEREGLWYYGADRTPYSSPPQPDGRGGWTAAAPAADRARPSLTWWRKRWVQTAGALLLGLIVGGIRGSTSAADADKRAADAEARVAAAENIAETARADAAKASAAADKAASDASAAVAARSKALDRREAQLVARERAVGAAEAAAKANTFGDGVHVVGVDIQPGTYHTAGGDGCYWAKMRQNEGIIENDLLDGPTTVTIESSVYKFKSEGCGTWTRR